MCLYTIKEGDTMAGRKQRAGVGRTIGRATAGIGDTFVMHKSKDVKKENIYETEN